MFKLVIIGCLSLINCGLSFNGFTQLFNTHEEPPIDIDEYKSDVSFTVKEKWIKQKLDHFNANSREWDMRYLENDRFFQPNGPIFIYIGGEWEISPGWISAGMLFEMAKENNGAMFYTEHRYYGKSRPTEDTSTKNLEFLTVEQALEDLRHFIQVIKSSNDYKNSGVVVVGGSYAGTLAAWARRQYPHLINGAWSSSAPLLAKFDFYEYNEVMTESIRAVGGESCLKRFENAFKTLEDYVSFSEPKVLLKIKEDFNLCEPLKLCRDVAHFFYELRDAVAALVQKHRTGDIERVCRFMMDPRYSDDAAALGAWINSKKKKCLDMNYEHAVKFYTNVTWGSDANKQLRQWTYQTCDRFAWFQSSTSTVQRLGSKHPQVGYFSKMCADLYDNKFTYADINKNVKMTNDLFGGLNPGVTNVYFSHGELDPWNVVGLQQEYNPESPAVVLSSYSHVPDFLPISSRDTEQMKASKLRVKVLVKGWLNLN